MLRHTLVFDWDETLGFSDVFRHPTGDDYRFDGLHGKLRPGTRELLTKLKKRFDLALYTAGTRDYIESNMKQTDLRELFNVGVWAREDLVNFDQKDITIIQPDLARVVLIDDANHHLHRRNQIPVDKFTGDMKDRLLFDLYPRLVTLAGYEDVRVGIQDLIRSWIKDLNEAPVQPVRPVIAGNFGRALARRSDGLVAAGITVVAGLGFIGLGLLFGD